LCLCVLLLKTGQSLVNIGTGNAMSDLGLLC